ncbi:hypothetical protein Dda3937_04504 [Dickeya dadantii 3937]|uniref:Uncharacterized protein n=1 Tax=Dickeya dadantii (strain 3937) TaxID=198628 RepID=E0SFT2_DICD3|nr:hypothetical protein Dda3937_04504 [Dickeya dadantii 3937]
MQRMLNPILTFRPLARPAAFSLTGASPAPASPFFVRSNDFAHSNGNITAQPDETGRHQPACADAIPLFQIKTHAYGSRRPGLVSIRTASGKSRSCRRLIT